MSDGPVHGDTNILYEKLLSRISKAVTYHLEAHRCMLKNPQNPCKQCIEEGERLAAVVVIGMGTCLKNYQFLTNMDPKRYETSFWHALLNGGARINTFVTAREIGVDESPNYLFGLKKPDEKPDGVSTSPTPFTIKRRSED